MKVELYQEWKNVSDKWGKMYPSWIVMEIKKSGVMITTNQNGVGGMHLFDNHQQKNPSYWQFVAQLSPCGRCHKFCQQQC